jgi:cobaltochelatase CobT
MAAMIKSSIIELNEISLVAAAKPEKTTATPASASSAKLPKIVPEEEILSSAKADAASLSTENHEEPSYEIAEINPTGKVDQETRKIVVAKPYYAFTRRFDEVVDAAALADKAELLNLYNYVSKFAAALKEIHGPKLTAKLSDYRKSTEGTPLAVSILIDNSGSMRGPKIIHTAAWCLLIVDWMDRLGIPTEILGYTTRAWKGGQSREAWLASGKSSNPGRLNDLRHLIYKPFSATAEVSAVNFGVMAREGILKENIDGEALLWAFSRLEAHPANENILFVVSDGAPVDDSTLSVNPTDFLEKHLKAVIAHLSKKTKLYAIGLEHDVSRYYPNAVSLLETSYLGIRFFETLIYDPAFVKSWKIEERKSRSGARRPRR